MKPQTGAFLDKAHTLLAQTDTMLEHRRRRSHAYFAGLHAAQALMFEKFEAHRKDQQTASRGSEPVSSS